MKEILKKLVGYYKPYRGLFFSDLFFAILGAAVTLVIPLIVRYITSTVVYEPVDLACAICTASSTIRFVDMFLRLMRTVGPPARYD